MNFASEAAGSAEPVRDLAGRTDQADRTHFAVPLFHGGLMRRIVGFVSLLLALACGSCAKSTAPDPNVAMYGTWSGVLRDTIDTSTGPQPQQFALVLQFGKGGVLPAIDGRTYASAVDLMHDPDVAFEIRRGPIVTGFVGTRTGDTLSGKAGWASFRGGTWTVVRSPMPWANGGSR